MATFFEVSGQLGAAAIYTSSGGDEPLYDPLAYLSQTKFHTGLAYQYRVSRVTGSITLPAVAADVSMWSLYNTDPAASRLFAHGQGSIPLIEGRITSGLSRLVRLNGSVPVQVGATGLGPQFPRMVHLGADATHVYLNAYGSTCETVGWPAITLGWSVDIMAVSTGANGGFDAVPSYFQCGPFDSRRRYMMADAPGADEPMTRGVTFYMSRPGPDLTDWRYSVAGYVVNNGSITTNTPYTLVTT